MLVTMPLMMLPMSPGVDLNLGNSFVPITGMVLLLRSVIEGEYQQVLPFIGPVVSVTLVCCLLAVRWAEEQFNRESVLFRESERLELGRWLVHLVRDRAETPSLAQAALCVALILVVQFFVTIALSAQAAGEMTFKVFAKAALLSQLACIFAPAALMTIMLTRNPARTLLLDRTPQWRHLWAAAGLALLCHPLIMRFTEGLVRLYRLPDATKAFGESVETALGDAPNWWVVLGLIALLPAVCEELAFRGFILSGFRHLGHKWWAIGLSAVAFGMVHPIPHQKIPATLMGVVIGYVAVQTGSLWPCVLLHALHNSLQVVISAAAKRVQQDPDAPLAFLFRGDAPLLYHPATVVVCGIGAAAIMWGLHGVTYRRTAEEQLEEARQQRDAPLLGA
jgi:sodium transport system permease protein